MLITSGVHHIGLTVSRLEDSAAFFTDLLGWNEVRKNLEYPAIYITDGTTMVSLWAVKEEPSAQFDRRRNIGLHHIAFRLKSESNLTSLYSKLADAGVKIEFAPELAGNGPAMHMMCLEPSGIRVEFIWPGD